MTLFNFTTDTNISNWKIVDDLVMGGRSNGQFNLDENGHGQFYGAISLENNGGFSSLRYNFKTVVSKSYSTFKLRLKGDGKSYQFRVKDNRNNRYSYISKFTTSAEWENIEIPFSDMHPSFRGNTLDTPNYNGFQMEEIAFLIGNKKNENFRLKIDRITLE